MSKPTKRPSLSAMHLKSILMTVNTKLEPQLDKSLLAKHQCHGSDQDSYVGLTVQEFYKY